MASENIWNNEEIVKTLQNGGIVVMPTDTLYGIVGRAENINTVEHIYMARKRSPEKPCIILIGDINELEKFSITLPEEDMVKLKEYWNPFARPTSVVLDCLNDNLTYLHRGTNSLAFRLPANSELRGLLLKTGPLVAPSANTEKFPASENITDAKAYFGDKVDLYVDGGEITSRASRIIRLHKDGAVTILRE